MRKDHLGPRSCTHGWVHETMLRMTSVTRLVLGAALLASIAPGMARAQNPGVGPGVAAAIQALLAEKAARSPAQRKLSSRLLYAARMRQGLPIARGVATLRNEVEVDDRGRTLVDLRADVTPELLGRITQLGGEVIALHPTRRAVRARLVLLELEALAELAEVQSVRPADRAYTRATNVSAGDVAHRTAQLRAALGVDGTGITVGVLSDGVDSLAAVQASGDLPSDVTVLAGQAGSGTEGTAMLEIVHDLAPGAALMFATAFTSQASFAANILALRTAGADVIVDDVGYFAEAVFQDDDVADAVNSVTSDGALYFSSAGNSGNLNDGTSGVWEGDFNFTGEPLNGAPAHDFGGGEIANTVTEDSPSVFTLQWSDPIGGSANDYDLFLLNKPMTVIFGASTNVQDGNDDPYEAIGSGLSNDKGRKLVVVRSSGADRFVHLNANRGQLAFATAGQTSGHASARRAFAVAAVDVADAGGGAFDGSESVQTYSSDGPRRVFYQADGTPITPGDFSATGGELRAKPDLTAADCVATASPGFSTFCGTSAAAPHAAAIAALLLELGAGSGLTNDEVRDVLTGTALDIEAPGEDRDSGAGIVDALAAGEALADSCQDGVDNDGDGAVDFPADPGCDSNQDASERSPLLPCDDGSDNDGDGLRDAAEDPGCRDATWAFEDPQCDDGLDNDGDGGIDWSGLGESPPDAQCVGQPWRNRERSSSCGLGLELVLVLPGLLAWRSRVYAIT